jgi:hypothetical protein
LIEIGTHVFIEDDEDTRALYENTIFKVRLGVSRCQFGDQL